MGPDVESHLRVDVRVGNALLSVEPGHRTFLRSIYWAVIAASIVVGLYDGSEDPPMDVVVREAGTSHIVFRDGPHMGIDSAYPVLEVFADEIRVSGLEGFLALRQDHG
jgi:hypothetical protein